VLVSFSPLWLKIHPTAKVIEEVNRKSPLRNTEV